MTVAKISTLILLAASLSACKGPSVNEYEPLTGLVRGTVLYPGGTARGNTIVLLFKSDDPPPPTGSGRPVNFVVVPRAQLFGESPEGTAGDFSAPFSIPTVPAGEYEIRAFLDADGDFNPLYDLLGQPTAGDVAGGYVDRETGAWLKVKVETGEVAEHSVLVTLAKTLPLERPAFAITSTRSFEVPMQGFGSLSIAAHVVDRAQVKMDPERTGFLIQYADDDRDGRPDDANGDHLADLYPKVLLRRIKTADDPRTLIIPLILSPLAYEDTLKSMGFAVAARLDLAVPPLAVELQSTGARVVLPEIPAGDYETVVISGTGQTWQVPNDLDRVQPEGGPDETQSVVVSMVPSAGVVPSGTIQGSVTINGGAEADAYVFAFREEAPPPPAGTGSPVAFASVPRASFEGGTAQFTLRRLPPGRYLVRGLLDADSDFTPLVSLLAQPSAGDLAGGSAQAIEVADGGAAEGVAIVLGPLAVPFERPAFAIKGGSARIARNGAPAVIELEAHPIAALGMTPELVKLPVAVDGPGSDTNGDNLPDLFPRVLLTELESSSGGDPRAAKNAPGGAVIPAIVDPLPYLATLGSGTALIPETRLRVIVPPFAVRFGPGGMRSLVSPVPAGRYRVNLISPLGQTWSVPNELDLLTGRAGTPLEDATQAGVVEIEPTPVPGGAITGNVTLLAPPPAGDFQVVVLAFFRDRPPPPRGSGRPVATAVVSKAAFAGGMSAPYRLSGLITGAYTVRAFLDADDDFVPWFDALNQPDAGDVGGGHVSPQGALLEVMVDAIGPPAADRAVTIVPAAVVARDRPVFSLPATEPVQRGAPIDVAIDAVNAASDALTANGRFAVQWADLDGDGTADDTNGDSRPDVFPLVIAELLDPEDASGLTLATPRRAMPGLVDPTQFAVLGFPAAEPTATSTVVEAARMTITFPPLSFDPANTADRGPPPKGKWRVTLISGSGQTWTTPNELSRAARDPVAVSQGRVLLVE